MKEKRHTQVTQIAAARSWKSLVQKLDNYRWLLPQDYKPGMRVPGLIFATEELLEVAGEEQALEQVANVAFLPGIVKYSMAMPDVHWATASPSEVLPRRAWMTV